MRISQCTKLQFGFLNARISNTCFVRACSARLLIDMFFKFVYCVNGYFKNYKTQLTSSRAVGFKIQSFLESKSNNSIFLKSFDSDLKIFESQSFKRFKYLILFYIENRL